MGNLFTKFTYLIPVVSLMLANFTANSQVVNDYFDNKNPAWKDTNGVHINAHGGGILVKDNIYYWFGEHKLGGEEGNKAFVGVHVYSSKDLYNWTDEGIALEMEKDTASLLQAGCIVERPKVIFNEKTGKYVMWFHHELKDQGYKAALTGVAVADEVTGPYRYLDSFRLHPGVWPGNFTEEQKRNAAYHFKKQDLSHNESSKQGVYLYRDFEKGQMSRDMTLFVDDDGMAYHITASEENGTLLISKLADDYLSLTDTYVRVFPGGRNEAPTIFRRNENYYMISSGLTGWDPNPARSAVATNILGPWTSLGNPVIGTQEEKAKTFYSQSTFVLPVADKKNAYIFMADRWTPENPIDGQYIWLPVEFEDDRPVLRWYSEWDLSIFKQ